ncbi:unnamed protein product [Tenebrio molitor]|nr:unnamed protein product [Tenebrio molitor]
MSYCLGFGILMPTKDDISFGSHSRRLEAISNSPLNGKFLSA